MKLKIEKGCGFVSRNNKFSTINEIADFISTKENQSIFVINALNTVILVT